MPGKVRNLQPVSLQISKISFFVFVFAEGIAKIISSILYSPTASIILSLPPIIGTPRRNFPWHPL